MSTSPIVVLLQDTLSLSDDQVFPTVLIASFVMGIVLCWSSVKVAEKFFAPKSTLPLEDFIPVPLIRKEILSHDTRRFTFGLPDKNATLGLPVGQHITLKYVRSEDGKAVQRSYTPVTDDTAIGYFSLVIKVYPPAPPKFPDGGLMSQHLDSLSIDKGDTILMKGPKGHMSFGTGGNFTYKSPGKPKEERTNCTEICMIAGGTGITPMLSVIQSIFAHPVTSRQNKKIRVRLLFANQTPNDILCQAELEALQRDHPDRFQLWYTVDRVAKEDKDDWKYSTGFINKDMIQKHLLFENGSSKKKPQVFLCGPPPMIKMACLPALEELGFTEKDWFVF